MARTPQAGGSETKGGLPGDRTNPELKWGLWLALGVNATGLAIFASAAVQGALPWWLTLPIAGMVLYFGVLLTASARRGHGK